LSLLTQPVFTKHEVNKYPMNTIDKYYYIEDIAQNS